MADGEYSNQHVADIHFVYGLCNGNANRAVTEYARMFPNRPTPNARTFVRIHLRITELGIRTPANERFRLVAPEEEEEILRLITQDPRLSTMSLCLSCISRSLNCIPQCFVNAASVIENTIPSNVNPVGGSILLQMLITVTYEELQKWAKKEALKEKSVANGEAHNLNTKQSRPKMKQVRIRSLANTNASSSVSFDGAYSSPSSIALAIAEALCSIDEDDKHTQEIQTLVAQSKASFELSNQFGLEDFPEFAEFFEEGNVPAANAERASDAAILTNQILMTSAGRDSLRVIYDHVQLHSEWVYKELGIQETCDVEIPLNKAPLLYIMFHIGRRPFDQFLRGEWPMPWSKLVAVAKAWSGVEGAKVHINRRTDVRNVKTHGKCNKQLLELYGLFKAPPEGLL